MSRRTTARPSQVGKARGRDASPPEHPVPRPPALLTEERDGLVLLHTRGDDTFGAADVADLARIPGEAAVTVLVSPRATAAEGLWGHLGAVLDSLGQRGVRAVRLAMSDTGADLPDRPPVARWIADAWRVEVTAPVGSLLAVPGGALFSCGERAGWRRFAPGAEPVELGPRLPVPPWGEALGAVPAATPGGSLVEHLPAGLLVRAADSEAVRPESLSLSLPVDPAGPALVVGVPGGDEVPVDDVLAVFGALPDEVAPTVRLVPGGPWDVLAIGQAVADARGHDVVVLSGVPVLRPGRDGVVAAPLGADGLPRWQPFVGAVACHPAPKRSQAVPPRPLDLATPLPGREVGEHGDIPLSERWVASVTRAGLWVRTAKGARPLTTLEPIAPEGPAIEVGRPGQKLDASVWPLLGQLLGELPQDVRRRAALLVHGTPRNGETEPRRLAAEHGLRSLHFGAKGRRAAVGVARTTPAAPEGGAAAAPGGEAERVAFRAFADGAWRRHRAAVEPVLAGMQALTGEEREAARAELIALRLYLHAADEPFDHATLAGALRSGAGDEALRAYAACVSRGLERLPAHQGLVLRAGAAGGALAPGATVADAAPVSGLAAGDPPAPGGDRLALWSVSGRSVAPLLDGGGAEVVFAPRTAFRVLEVRDVDGMTLTLAREESEESEGADATDDAVLARLDKAIGRLPGAAQDASWPARCTGPLAPAADETETR
ncbi:hypothetical protein [Streptomyces radicis]|uniref:Uncharacterized protein n=1 Tax=Streptomyces radicis TaxID=1750517 RepID=A0A3A9WF91_9ACTN|nr:hypothetical protein [Streptomyces radicis]RKN04737.1 hypothetical protein D7319_27290 [Streptomyces radicis]RKN15943.1 hypothetical protein D7318_26335 [Streptomyces radicis]